MDKLKPIIVHKFWIILVIAMLLPVVGWSMATGNLAKEIEERKSAINQAFTDSQIPANPPNQTWSTALKQINQEKDYSIGLSWKRLWDKQQSLFVWPPDISPLMKNTPYRGEISRVPRNLYRSAYEFELLRAHKLANPFNYRDGTGLVDIKPNVIPHVPLDKWKTLPPTSKEMWDAQEDVWLVSSILSAIAEVNKGATNIGESPVRQISVLELRGGTVGDTGGDVGGGEGADMVDMGGVGGGFGAGGAGRSMQRNGDRMQNIDIDIDLSEIFGNDADTSAESGGEGEAGGADVGLAGDFGGGGPGNGRATQNLKRYYHEAEELPYKTRAFYIKAVIESGKLPNLITELTNMPWPAEIMRVQRVDLLDDNLKPIANISGDTGGRRSMGGAGDFSAERQFGSRGAGRPGAGGFGAAAEGLSGRGDSAGQEHQRMRDAALNDPQLAVVTIAGLMTLYKPYVPPEGVDMAENKENEANPNQPADETAAPSDAGTTPELAESPAGSNPAVDATNTPDEKPSDPAGNNPQQPTESTEPKQPTDSQPDATQTPKTDAKSAEPNNK